MSDSSASPKGDQVDRENLEDPVDEKLLQPYFYLASNGGKGVRKVLALAMNHWLNISEDKVAIISEVVDMLHNASLIIDDIEDSSVLRRGQPVAHKIYGLPLSINSANMVFFIALKKLLTLDHPEAINIFTDQMIELHRGQGMELYWRDSHICPTMDEYRLMVLRKTGGLFGLALRLMQLFSTVQIDFKPLLDDLGLLFQIRDDYINLTDESYHESKTFCEDLTEGKYSYPIVHAIRHNPHDSVVSSILLQRTRDVDVKRFCVKRLAELGSLSHTKEVLQALEKQALSFIKNNGGNPHLVALLQSLNAVYQT